MFNGYVHVQAFHDDLRDVLAVTGAQVGPQSSPPQQFSVRNAIRAFMVVKFAV
jgi:hypothetical protein